MEVALGVQFEPLPQMRQGHVGLFWASIYDQYPKTLDMQPVEPGMESFDDQTPVFRLAISSVPSLHRAWFVSADDTLLLQLQSDRLIHNWRQVRGEPYPRFETLYDTFAERFEQFEAVLDRTGVPRPVYQQVEVTYINWIETQSFADLLNPLHHHPLGLHGIGSEPDEEDITLRFPVSDNGRPTGRLYVHARHAERRLPDQQLQQGVLMDLSFRAPVPPTTQRSDVGESMYRGRDVIVDAFTALTRPDWHETWERTK